MSAHFQPHPEDWEKDPKHQASGLEWMKVLVMDDEACMRSALTYILEKWGCEVKTASHGQEAIDLYGVAKTAGRPFDVVIFDLMVRDGVQGPEALQEILKIDPHLHAVAMSGCCSHPAFAFPQKHGFKTALEKPFDTDLLKEALNRVEKKRAGCE